MHDHWCQCTKSGECTYHNQFGSKSTKTFSGLFFWILPNVFLNIAKCHESLQTESKRVTATDSLTIYIQNDTTPIIEKRHCQMSHVAEMPQTTEMTQKTITSKREWWKEIKKSRSLIAIRSLKRYIRQRSGRQMILTLIAPSVNLGYVALLAGRGSKKCQTLQPAKTE